MVFKNWIVICRRIEIEKYVLLCISIKFKCIEGFSIRFGLLKLLKERVKEI